MQWASKSRRLAAYGSVLSQFCRRGLLIALAALWALSGAVGTSAAFAKAVPNSAQTTSQGAQTARFTFNAQHQLIGVALPDGTKIDYAYGADGNIASRSKTLPAGTRSTTHFLVDPTGPFPRILAEYDDKGHMTTTFVYGDELLARTRNGVTAYYQHDGHGSVVAITDDKGATTQARNYDAWGNVESIGADDNAFGYTGELQDPDTGLIYLRARWYNPQLGRFISPDQHDPSDTCGTSPNRYTYAGGDPVNASDPSGNQTLGELNTAGQANSNLAIQNGQTVVRSAFRNAGCELGAAIAEQAVTYGIYILIDEVSGRLYVGQSVNIDKRFEGHIKDAVRKAINFWKANAKIIARLPIPRGIGIGLDKAEQLVKEILEHAGEDLLNRKNPIAKSTPLYKNEFQAFKRALCGKVL